MHKVLIGYFFGGILTVFLIINILASAAVSPLFAPFVDGNYEAAVEYLIRIKKRPEFKEEYAKFKKIYGDKIEERVFSENAQRSATIRNFEVLLAKNPKSRDILFALSQLHFESGNKDRAAYYLDQAKAVDPAVK